MNDEDQTVETTVDTTPDAEAKIKAQKKAAADKMMARKRAALDILIALAQRLGDASEKEAAVYLTPGRHIGATGGAPKAAKADYIDLLFLDSDTAHEDDIYLSHKLGRTEMKKVIQQGVNQGVWITFDPTTGNYKVVARGTQPDGWLGPVPKQPKVL